MSAGTCREVRRCAPWDGMPKAKDPSAEPDALADDYAGPLTDAEQAEALRLKMQGIQRRLDANREANARRPRWVEVRLRMRDAERLSGFHRVQIDRWIKAGFLEREDRGVLRLSCEDGRTAEELQAILAAREADEPAPRKSTRTPEPNPDWSEQGFLAGIKGTERGAWAKFLHDCKHQSQVKPGRDVVTVSELHELSNLPNATIKGILDALGAPTVEAEAGQGLCVASEWLNGPEGGEFWRQLRERQDEQGDDTGRE